MPRRQWLFVVAMALLVSCIITAQMTWPPAAPPQNQKSADRSYIERGNNVKQRPSRQGLTDDPVAFATLIVAFATGALAVSTIGLLIATLRQVRHAEAGINASNEANRLARDNFIIDIRPWIAVTDVRPVGPIYLDQNGVVIDIEITIKNVGRSPAGNIAPYCRVYPRIHPELYGDNFVREYDSIISRAQLRFSVTAGGTLFPEQEDSLVVRLVIPIDRLKIDPNSEYPGTIITPIIVGCIDYLFMTTDSDHPIPDLRFCWAAEHHSDRHQWFLRDRSILAPFIVPTLWWNCPSSLKCVIHKGGRQINSANYSPPTERRSHTAQGRGPKK